MTPNPPSAFAPLLGAWPEAVLLVSGEGVVRATNHFARRLLHLSEAPPDGTPLAEFFGAATAAALLPAEGQAADLRIGEDAAATGRPILRARSAKLPDGDFLVRLDDGADEQRLRSHLEHAERLASIGELLSSVAHELANPLTTVLGYADLLLAEDDDRIPRDEIERIRAEALRCRRIVGNLLDLSRAESFERRPLSLEQVVDKVIEFRSYSALVGQIDLVRDTGDDLPAVEGDQHRLVQAVLNLVTNAEDAVRDLPSNRRVTLRTRRTALGAAVEVEDTGPGVPDAIREFIFEPFFTTKPRGRGTGLGLSLVRTTAKLHGGTVRVDTASGGGALFVLDLPAAV